MEEETKITGKGGRRPGAGRPKGKKNVLGIKHAVKEYTSPQELKNLVERAKKMAKTDKVVLMWYLEQIFGKAKATGVQPQGKTVNNIALFLDSLEKQNGGNTNQPIPINGRVTSGADRVDGFSIVRQTVETETPLLDNEQEGEENTV